MNLFKLPACGNHSGNKHDPGLNGAEPALWNQNVSGQARSKLYYSGRAMKKIA